MIRLICLDVDGTLVGSSGVVSDEVWRAADALRARGVRLAICSGRPGFGVTREFANRLDAEGWHVFQNGASVVHLPSGRSLSKGPRPELVKALVERARSTRRILELYGDSEYAVESSDDRARRHAALLGLPFEPRPLESLRGAVVRAQWLIAPEEEQAVIGEPHPGLELAPSTSPLMPDTLFVNVTATGVNKGSAVRALAAEHEIALDQVMFVGDGQNDLDALRTVGFAVAMGNAEPAVRRAADRVVGHVDEGGLLEALELVRSRLER